MYRAFLLCNSTFPADPAGLHRLRGPQRDGLLLWNALVDRETGRFSQENAHVLFEASRADAAEAIEGFFTSADVDDVLLFYYSGHGRRQSGELILCCRDTLTTRPMSTGLGCDSLNKVIRTSSARAVIVVLDCCFGGAFKGEESVADDLAGAGRFVIAAASAVEEANDAEKDGHASPFTAALSYGLTGGALDSDHDGLVTLEDLFSHLSSTLPPTCPRPRRNFDGAGTIPIAVRARKSRETRDGQPQADIPFDQFDQLIEQLALPMPRLSTREKLVALGPTAIAGVIDVLLELIPSQSSPWYERPRMTDRQRRLVPRLREILTRMMPGSGERLLERLKIELDSGDVESASRLIECITKGTASDSIKEFFLKLIRDNLAPSLLLQVICTLDESFSYPIGSLDLTSRAVEDFTYRSTVSLSGLDFASSEFRNARLYGLDLSDNYFDSVVFDNCTLSQVRFDRSSLRKSRFLAGLGGFWMPGASFAQCDLSGSRFERVYADEQFRDNNKKDIDRALRISFAGARLDGSAFIDSDLRLADFTGCQGFEDVTDWSGSRLYRARGLSYLQFDIVRQLGGHA